MKAFWKFLAAQAVRLAVYAVDHPDQVIALVTAVKKQNAVDAKLAKLK